MNNASRPVAVYALTAPGSATAGRIVAELDSAELFLPERLAACSTDSRSFVTFVDILAQNWGHYSGHVAVAAAGIVVRAMAPLLADKKHDPAVVVLDHNGHYAVSLLAGHLGGANELARRIADILGGQAVITTGTDAMDRPSLDLLARDRRLIVENWEALPRISRAVLESETVMVRDPEGWLKPALEGWPELFHFADDPSAGDDSVIWVGEELRPFPASWLIMRPPSLVAGMGCNRGTPADEIVTLLRRTLDDQGWSASCLAVLASIEAKQDEAGLLEAARLLNMKTVFYPAAELAQVDAPHPSAVVEKHMGVKSVCEAAALQAAGPNRLLVPKTKTRNVTLALARADSRSSVWDRVLREE